MELNYHALEQIYVLVLELVGVVVVWVEVVV
jgi:hypothetical protein